MNYSYTQISQFVVCPRRYRYRYLDGWQEKDVRAAMLFGRAFEQAVAALFRGQDPAVILFEQWAPARDLNLVYSHHDTWDSYVAAGRTVARTLRPGRPGYDSASPASQQQVPFTRSLSSANGFVAYIDAIGELDGTPCVLEWKTSSARYPEEPAGLTALDPQLVCYSWMTGIDEVAQVCSSASARSRCNICGRPSRTSNAATSKTSSMMQCGGSSRGFPATEWNPISAESVYYMSLCRALSRPFANWSIRPCFASQELILVCLTNLLTDDPSMPPKLNRRRALLVLSKIDEFWLGRLGMKTARYQVCGVGKYLCEVRAGQYWRLERLKSFDESWNGVFQDRAEGVLPDVDPRTLATSDSEGAEAGRLDQGEGAGHAGAQAGTELRKCTLGAQGPDNAARGISPGNRKGADWEGQRAHRADLLQGLQEPGCG